jgi:hypothetical protein
VNWFHILLNKYCYFYICYYLNSNYILMASASTTNNLSLGSNVEYKVDPTIPQSIQQSTAQINQSNQQHVELINATTGGRRRRRRQRRSSSGGATGDNTITVTPLPLGAASANSQENNVAMSSLFANALSASKYDSAVTPPPPVKGGGNRRRYTRRLSNKRNKRTYKRRTPARRTKRRKYKSRKTMKSKRSKN